MASKLSYSDKVKASKALREAILSLNDGETIDITYGKKSNGEKEQYEIRCYESQSGGVDSKQYSIWNRYMSGMNIGSLTKTQAKCYTYDMMTQRTNYNFPLYEMELVEVHRFEQFEFSIGE